ncbi:hypothetical protein jhhlp_006969 [Lomentospora prolificans]|uniref:Uncharacterized protein n=1 Tax=Lomentospora prolificans TaxID=41688 RepID=A0A2N3N1C1_9PEZI|nr:hypothetical protein jhhlp_006969 [Lomentospora prolificans]
MSAEPSPAATPSASTEAGPATGITRRPRRSWTPWEDQTLRTRVAHYVETRGTQWRWKEVAQAIPGRTAKDCRKRWLHSLDPSLRKGRWTEEEDRILLDAYARLGPAWNEIANLIPGRKDDQCSKRYRDILGPLASNRLSDWTPEEDQILRDGVRDLGHRWTSVAARLPGRPPLTCRNRWRNLCKQRATTDAAEGQETPPQRVESAAESDVAGQSVSPTMSWENEPMDTPFNFADPTTADVNDIARSLLDHSHPPSRPAALGSDFNQLELDQMVQDDSVISSRPSGYLDTAANANLGGFPDLNFSSPDYGGIGTPLGGVGPSMFPNKSIDGPLGGQPPAVTSTVNRAAGQATGHGPQRLNHDPPTNPSDYRAFELAAEMASRAGQPLPNIPEEPPPARRANRALSNRHSINTITTITITITTTITTIIIITTINWNVVWTLYERTLAA